MSNDKTALYFPDDAVIIAPSGVFTPHPFAGLPAHLVSQVLTDPVLQVAGTGGVMGHFDHFVLWNGPTTEAASGGWNLTGTTGAATIAAGTGRTGEIVLTADATASASPTLRPFTVLPFQYTVGKRWWFFARLKLGTVASTETFVGFGTSDADPTVTNTLPADGVFFEKATAATAFDFHARKDGTSTERTSATTTVLADATYTTLGFTVDTRGDIMPWQNGVPLTASAINVGTANIPSGSDPIVPHFAIMGASQTMTLDWILFAQEV